MIRKTLRMSLLPLGTIALVGFFAITHATTTAEPYDPFTTFRVPWIVAYIVVFLTSAYAVGLPEVPRSRSGAALSAVAAVGAATVFVSVFQLALSSPLLPRMVVGGSSLALVPFAVLCWRVQVDLHAASTLRVFVVGDSDNVASLRADLVGHAEAVAVVVGAMSTSEARGDGLDERPLVDAVRSVGADVVAIDVLSQADDRIVRQAAEVHGHGVRIRTISLFSEENLGKIPLSEMHRMSLLFDIGEVHRQRYVRVKRLLDLAIAFLALPVLAVAGLIVMVLNVIGNRGPLMYSQERVGKGGQDFRIHKFRSMRPAGGPTTWTLEDDHRITTIGKFLRKSHLDELPQLINVLRGDLSIVGPRPEQRVYVDELVEKIPFYDTRHLVRPGLTGWAQTNYGYGADDEDAREKLQYDLYYLRRQSLALDVRIVLRTLRTLVLSPGR